MLTDEQYQRALQIAGALIAVDPAPDSVYGRRLLKLVPLIEEYEREHFPLLAPARSAGLEVNLDKWRGKQGSPE